MTYLLLTRSFDLLHEIIHKQSNELYKNLTFAVFVVRLSSVETTALLIRPIPQPKPFRCHLILIL